MDSRKVSCIAAAAFVSSMLVVGTTGLAHAQQPVVVEGRHYIDPETQRVVGYGDLNLADRGARETLIRRVGYAVNSICEVNTFRSFASVADNRECSTAAWNSANPQIAAAIERSQSGASIAATALIIAGHR